MAIIEVAAVRETGRNTQLPLQKQPNIWFISGANPQTWGGGLEEAVNVVAREFAEQGSKVSSLHGSIYTRPLRDEVLPADLAYVAIPPARFLDFKGFSMGRFLAVRRLIELDRPDFVVVNMPCRMGLAAALALRNSSIPTTFWWHGSHVATASDSQYDFDQPSSKVRSLARRFIINPVKTQVVRYISAGENFQHAACSQFTAELLQKKSVLTDNIKVLYPATSVGLRGVDYHEGTHLDEVRDEDIVVFIPARVSPDKQFFNVRELLTGIQTGSVGSRRINFVSAGAPAYDGYLDYAFPSLDTEVVKTTYLGILNREGMERVYSRADCILMPNREEPFGLATVEGMRFGLPVLGFNSGGTAEILQGFPDYPKYLIDEKRGQIGIDHVRTFLESVTNQRPIALNQRDLVMKRFDPGKLAGKVFQFIASGDLGGNCTRV